MERTKVNGDIEHQNLNGNSIKEKELPNEKENFKGSFKLIQLANSSRGINGGAIFSIFTY